MKRAHLFLMTGAMLLAPCASLAQTSREEDIRGQTMMNEGRFAEAGAAFERALALEPNNARAAWSVIVITALFLKTNPCKVKRHGKDSIARR